MDGLGVQTHLARRTSAVLGDAHVTGLMFDDGTRLACDMVVISAGIRPNVGLARDAGLAVDRGIVVGDDLRSPSDSAIFAIGECAQHRGMVYGLVAPLWEQAQVLADRLTDRDTHASYRGSRVSTKLKVMGVDLATMGDKEAGPGDEVVQYSEPSRGVYKKMVVRDGRLAGAILLGDPDAAPAIQQAFDRALALPENRAELLFPLMRVDAPLVGRGPSRRRADLQLQWRHQGAAVAGDRRGLPEPASPLRRDARGHRLRLVQAAGRAGAVGACRRPGRRRSGGALLRAWRASGQTGPGGRDSRAQPAKRVGRVCRTRRRP